MKGKLTLQLIVFLILCVAAYLLYFNVANANFLGVNDLDTSEKPIPHTLLIGGSILVSSLLVWGSYVNSILRK